MSGFFQWITENKEWVFSGVGIFVIGLGYSVFKRIKENKGAIEESLNKNVITGNNNITLIGSQNTITTNEKLPENALPVTEVENGKYRFCFTIDVEGKATEICENTVQAIHEWYNDENTIKAELQNKDLSDTFDVEIEDLRIPIIDNIVNAIAYKVQNNIKITRYEHYLLSGEKGLKREVILTEMALEKFLSNKIIHGILNVNHPVLLMEMISTIINFKRRDLESELPSSPERIAIDIYLSNSKNETIHYFVAFVNKEYIKKKFGGTGVWDLKGHSVLKLGDCLKDVVLCYLFELVRLELNGFDFSKNYRVLNLSNYSIGLH